MNKIVGVKFQDWGKIYSFDPGNIDLGRSDKVIVESEEGLGFGTVKTVPSEAGETTAGRPLKKVVRKATEEDLMQLARNREKEEEARDICRQKIGEMGLHMKLVGAEYLFDGSKAIFYFTAEERVDFRELVRELAWRLHTRIEMRQIGVRDEARMKCGIGPCGRVLCCSSWITSFEPVSVKMAKTQRLSLNPANISGMCGRLLCCLAFEHQNYLDGVMTKSSCGGCGKHETNKEPLDEAVAIPLSETPPAACIEETKLQAAPASEGSENGGDKQRPKKKKRRWRKRK